jgi:prepilin-type N-terminal cleavage/methylation domain-containing protein
MESLGRPFRGQKGVTLIELAIVVIIIGILASQAIPYFLGTTVKAKQSEAKQILKTDLRDAESLLYRVRHLLADK